MAKHHRRKHETQTSTRGAPTPVAVELAQVPSARSRFVGLAELVALAVILVAVALIRWHLLAVPFERDEGEYAYMGNLILHGGLPYRDAYNMKLPGTYAMYALIMAVFGSSPAAVHAGFALVSLATIVLLFAAARRLFSPSVALVAAGVYGLLSTSPTFLGSAAHATHFVNLFAVLGLYLYARFRGGLGALRAATIGLAFGLAVLMKQQAAFLAVFGGVIVLVDCWTTAERRTKATVIAALSYALGVLVPYLAVLLVMVASGAFDKFWFWTVTYASAYAEANTPWEVARALFAFAFQPMFDEYPVVWLLGGAGLVIVWIARYSRAQKILVTLLALSSAAAIVPGFNFRQHYFVLLLPVLGLLAGVALDYATMLVPVLRRSRVAFVAPLAVVALAALSAIAGGRHYYIDDPPDAVARTLYAGNPFTEAPAVGRYLADHAASQDTIAVIGSEPEILVYAGRRSATRYLYAYPMVEPHRFNRTMQQEMIAELSAAPPRYMVYCDVAVSWRADPSAPTDILQWFNAYARDHYQIVGVVEMGLDGQASEYYWDAEARGRRQRDNSLYILERKGA